MQAEIGRRYLETINTTLEEVPFETLLGSVEHSGSPRSRVLRVSLELGERFLFGLRRLRDRRRERQPPDDNISSSSGMPA